MHLYVHHLEIRLRSTAYSCLSCCSCCDAGEMGRKMCALCGECCLTQPGNILHAVHTSCHPTLQHYNSYNRTDNYRQWNAVGSPDDGHKNARNMLRYYWLPINHYLLRLVGLTFAYLSKTYGHSNIKFDFSFKSVRCYTELILSITEFAWQLTVYKPPLLRLNEFICFRNWNFMSVG